MRGIFLLIISGICLGTIGIFVKMIGQDISPFLLATLRVGSVALLIFLILLARKRPGMLKMGKRDILLSVLAGFFGVVIGMGFYIKSITLIRVSTAVFIVYLYPVVTVLLARIFLKEDMSRKGILSLALTMLGVYLIYGMGIELSAEHALGAAFALAAGIGYSVLIVSMRYFENKGYGFWDVIFWPMLFGAAMMIPIAFSEGPVFAVSYATALPLAGIILVSTFLAYILYAMGLRTIRANAAPIVQTLAEPLSAVALAWLVLGETIPEFILLGGSIIVLANLIMQVHRKKRIRVLK